MSVIPLVRAVPVPPDTPLTPNVKVRAHNSLNSLDSIDWNDPKWDQDLDKVIVPTPLNFQTIKKKKKSKPTKAWTSHRKRKPVDRFNPTPLIKQLKPTSKKSTKKKPKKKPKFDFRRANRSPQPRE